MPNRNLSKIQEALNELTTAEKYINELEYYRKHLYSPNHSKGTCNSTVALITQLNTDHANLVNALITYGIQYESDDASLAARNNPDYKYSGSTSSFTYTSAPEHQKTFWEKTVSQVVLGDFSDDVTWLGTTANVLLSFTGIDLVLDIRDTCGSVSKKDGWGTALNLLTLLPVVGVLGELGKVAKHGDDIVDAGSTFIKHGDDIVDGGSSIIKNGDNAINTGTKSAISNSNIASNNIVGKYTPVEYKGTVKVNGEIRDVSRRVYQGNDFDIDYFDDTTGLTNLERMKKGLSPIGSDGKPIQLHHLTQQEPGSMVEILELKHHDYYSQLHGLVENGRSFRNNPVLNKQYNNFRNSYWKWRANQIIGGK